MPSLCSKLGVQPLTRYSPAHQGAHIQIQEVVKRYGDGKRRDKATTTRSAQELWGYTVRAGPYYSGTEEGQNSRLDVWRWEEACEWRETRCIREKEHLAQLCSE